MTFRLLQDAAQTNPSLLNTRLGELHDARLVMHDVSLRPLVDWAGRWGAGQREEGRVRAPR